MLKALLSYDFMKLAFLAIIIISPLFGILGTMIVSKKMAFFSDALGHSALTGIAVGVLLGIRELDIAMVIFAVLFSLMLNEIGRRTTASKDTIISVFSSASLAIGLAILSKGGNFSKYSAMLVGDILSITRKEVIYLAVILVVTIVFWVFCGNKLEAINFNAALARSRGLKVSLLENLFSILVALVVMVSIKWVGILIINALLILPAAASANVSTNLREYHLISVVFSLFAGIFGLIVSYFTNVATGPMIVIISAIIYFATYFYVKKVKA